MLVAGLFNGGRSEGASGWVVQWREVYLNIPIAWSGNDSQTVLKIGGTFSICFWGFSCGSEQGALQASAEESTQRHHRTRSG